MNDKNMRKWNCRHCGRANMTPVTPDGKVTCDHCTQTTAIQPSRLPKAVAVAPPRKG